MDKDEYLAEFAKQERERLNRLKEQYRQGLYWGSLAQERWGKLEEQPQKEQNSQEKQLCRKQPQEEKKQQKSYKKSESVQHQRQKLGENKSHTKQRAHSKNIKSLQKKVNRKKHKCSKQNRQARANAIQRILIEIIAAAGLFQSGKEIHITQEAMLEILAEKYNEPMSKQTLIKHLNFLVDNHFISRQVYVFSNGRGTIQKRTTYRLLPKALRILAGILKLGEKIKRRYYSVGKELKKWIKKEIKKLAGFRIQETKVNMKRWLEKQRFRLLKCSHPAVLMLESE